MTSTPSTGEIAPQEPEEWEHEDSPAAFSRALPWLLLVGGLIGLTAAFVLTLEKFSLAENPNYIPSCDFSVVLSCGTVMDTDQASAFGFPNPLIGVAGFAVVAAIGAALLAGARLAAWFWSFMEYGLTLAVLFVHWLIYQSLYSIGALCPYCMVVWAVTIPMWWYVTLRNIDQFGASAWMRRLSAVLTKYHWLPLAVWYLVIVGLVGDRFWYYWSTLL